MKKQFVAATVLALSAMTGIAQADLASDLTRMPASEALAIAVQDQSVSIEVLISEAAAQLGQSPQLLNALVSAAVAAYPEQAAQIVYQAVKAAPAQAQSITNAAVAQLANNPDAQQAVSSSANVAVQDSGFDRNTPTEVVAENTEVTEVNTATPAVLPPPPAVRNSGSSDKPTSVSPQ